MSPRSYSQNDGDSTPAGGSSPHRQPTDPAQQANGTPLDLILYQLKELKREARYSTDQNSEILAQLAQIRQDAAVHATNDTALFKQIVKDVDDLKGTRNRATAGLITGLFAVIGSVIAYFKSGH